MFKDLPVEKHSLQSDSIAFQLLMISLVQFSTVKPINPGECVKYTLILCIPVVVSSHFSIHSNIPRKKRVASTLMTFPAISNEEKTAAKKITV